MVILYYIMKHGQSKISKAPWSGGWDYVILQMIYTPETEIDVSIRVTTTANIDYFQEATLTIYEI